MDTDRRSIIFLLALAALTPAACRTGDPSSRRQVEQAWTDRSAATTRPASPSPGGDAPVPSGKATASPPVGSSLLASSPIDAGDVIAYADDVPIARSRLVDLLLAGHGVGLLEQLVVLSKAERMAAEHHIMVTQRDIELEYDRSLRRLLSPLPSANDDEFDRPEAERLLDDVLSRRNVSRAEYMLGMTRNAYLRALVHANMSFSLAQLQAEYDLAFTEQVQVRHVQVANLADADRVASLLAGGADFAATARDYSANPGTAAGGGLLRPFSQHDPDVPPALREAAFLLTEGEVTNPIRVDEWYHILRLERRIPADRSTLDAARPQLERRLRERLTEPAMQTLYRTLFEQTDIRIVDPVLADDFVHKHPERDRR